MTTFTFPDPLCMTCGDTCDLTDEVGEQLWCYCKACDVDTFHPGEPYES